MRAEHSGRSACAAARKCSGGGKWSGLSCLPIAATRSGAR